MHSPSQDMEITHHHLPWERTSQAQVTQRSPKTSSQETRIDAYFRHIHEVNELVTPDVQYDTWKEFVDLVYSVQNDFCDLLADAVCDDMHVLRIESVRAPIHGTQNEMHHEVPARPIGRPITLAHMREHGPEIVMRLTKQQGPFWCAMVSHFVCARALRAAAMYEDFISSHSYNQESPLQPLQPRVEARLEGTITDLVSAMQREVRHTFSGAMPFSIYTLCSGFISTLLVKNFTFYHNTQLTAFTHTQFQHILLTLAHGLHPRLGANSMLQNLDNDTLRLVCASLSPSQLQKHILFHAQEQWLY